MKAIKVRLKPSQERETDYDYAKDGVFINEWYSAIPEGSIYLICNDIKLLQSSFYIFGETDFVKEINSKYEHN